jgi:hypothetical protein
MKKQVKFFVEGKADVKFIKDYLTFLGVIVDTDFVIIGSNNEAAIQNRLNDFQRSTLNENTNLLIFDADGSKADTETELERIKAKLGIDFELFLFPNHVDRGNLETLLEEIINTEHLPIFECFEGYQQCLSVKSETYKVPATKTKIYAYVDTLVSKNDEKLAKEEHRDYLNNEHWNLHSEELNPLKEFLQKYVL